MKTCLDEFTIFKKKIHWPYVKKVTKHSFIIFVNGIRTNSLRIKIKGVST